MKRLEVGEEEHAKIKEWAKIHKKPIWWIVSKIVEMARNTDIEEAE